MNSSRLTYFNKSPYLNNLGERVFQCKILDMKIKKLKTFIFLIISFLIASCGSPMKVTPATDNLAPQQAVGSLSDAQLEAQERQRLLDHYTRLRLEEQNNPELRQRRIRQQIQAERTRVQQNSSRQLRHEHQTSDRPQTLEVEKPLPEREISREQMIQAEQIIDYHCIQKHIKECSDKKEEFYAQCEQRYLSHQVSNFITCIRSQLRGTNSSRFNALPKKTLHLSYTNKIFD